MDIWQILMTPFSWLLKQFCLLFNSYGAALILFTVVIKLILAPFQLKGKKSMIQMNILSAQQKEIQARYANNPNKQNEELQKLYAKNGVNPMSGCLWSLLPAFLLFPLYAIIRRPMKYMMWLTEEATVAVASALGWSDFTTMGTNELVLASRMNAENIAAASAAAGSDSLFLINFNFLGLDLSQIPQWELWKLERVDWNAIGLFIMPVISAALAVLSMIIMTKTNAMNQQQEQSARSQNRTMLILQPVLSLWIGFGLPAGMCIYWISNSVLTTVQELIFGRMLKKDYEEAQRKIAEQAAATKQAEKERRRQAAERKAAAMAEKKSGRKKSGQAGSREETGPAVDRSAGRVGMRQYARGRAYDPNRYPVTPYHDPNRSADREEEPEELTEEEKGILTEDAKGAALLEQAEAPAVKEEDSPVTEEGDSTIAEEDPPRLDPPSGEEGSGAAPRYDAPVYDKPDFDGKQ